MTRRLLALALAVVTLAGCARTAPATTTTPAAPAGSASSTAAATPSATADVWVVVLQHYLATPGDNSFDHQFPVVYVLATAYPDAADPAGTHQPGTPIGADAQQRITAAVPGTRFVADKSSVIDSRDRCAVVKGGGILVTLGTPDGTGDEVHVGISGFVACLGATWLTYVVHRDGSAWKVTGTTGPHAIA